MDTFPTQDVIAACQEYGKLLKVPSGLDGRRVMLAIAAVESGGADPAHAGHNCGPRFEPAYFEDGGFYRFSRIQQQLVAQHGRAAACSFGPWQMMFCNFSEGLSPQDLSAKLQLCAEEFVRNFNRASVRWSLGNPDETLDHIGQVWNIGHKAPDTDYTTKLQRAYAATESYFRAPGAQLEEA